MTEVLSYQDPVYGTKGWLALDSGDYGLAVGGCRVQPNLTSAQLATLASRMTLKQRVLGIPVSGAKCGLDLDPHAPHKADVLCRFLAFLAPLLTTRLSLGCDMGTTWAELERVAAASGIPSVKYAVKVTQALSDEEFRARLGLLDVPVGLLTVGQRRAGHALAHAALAMAPPSVKPTSLTCTVQGFGTLGRSAAYTLAEMGVTVVAIADEHGCVSHPDGLDVARMVAGDPGTPVPDLARGALPRADIFSVPASLVILAANQDSLSVASAGTLATSAVVVGANCGLSPAAETVLASRGVPVVPDFVGGIGGSASMECLFGPASRPTAPVLLDTIATLMRSLVSDLRRRADSSGVTLTSAALALAGSDSVPKEARPYGNCRYTNSLRTTQLVTAGES